jgi:hypothetical protein
MSKPKYGRPFRGYGSRVETGLSASKKNIPGYLRPSWAALLEDHLAALDDALVASRGGIRPRSFASSRESWPNPPDGPRAMLRDEAGSWTPCRILSVRRSYTCVLWVLPLGDILVARNGTVSIEGRVWSLESIDEFEYPRVSWEDGTADIIARRSRTESVPFSGLLSWCGEPDWETVERSDSPRAKAALADRREFEMIERVRKTGVWPVE